MKRNKATDFFNYDEEYFNKLANIKETEFYGITQNNILVAGGIFLFQILLHHTIWVYVQVIT